MSDSVPIFASEEFLKAIDREAWSVNEAIFLRLAPDKVVVVAYGLRELMRTSNTLPPGMVQQAQDLLIGIARAGGVDFQILAGDDPR